MLILDVDPLWAMLSVLAMTSVVEGIALFRRAPSEKSIERWSVKHLMKCLYGHFVRQSPAPIAI